MIKELAILSMLSASVNINYVELKNIEYYQNEELMKHIKFEFASDYLNSHEIVVFIRLYDSENLEQKVYKNTLKVIGIKSATANFEVEDNTSYAILEVNYNNKVLYGNIKINFLDQSNCYIDKFNRTCNFIYLTKFEDSIVKDYSTNMIVRNDIFDKYLSTNVLDVSNLYFYSDYDFKNANIVMYIKNRRVKDEYEFNLKIIGEKVYSFEVIDTYYVKFDDFSYDENYFIGSIETDKIIFPYTLEFQEYDCQIIIDSTPKIYIDFNITNRGQLFGDCNNSKFCIVRSSA